MITKRAERQRTKYSPIPATPETHKIIKMESVRLGITLMDMMDKFATDIKREGGVKTELEREAKFCSGCKFLTLDTCCGPVKPVNKHWKCPAGPGWTPTGREGSSYYE